MSLLPALPLEPGAGQGNGRRCWALGSQHGGAAAVPADSGGEGRTGAGARQPGKPCARASSAGSVLHVRSLDLHDSLDFFMKECCIFKCCRLPVVLAVRSHQPDMWPMPCISDLEQWYSAAKAQGHFAPLRPLTVGDSLLRLTGMVVQLAQSQCTGQPAAFLGAFGSSMLDPASHQVMQTPRHFNDERRQQQAALVTLEAGAAEAAAAAGRLGLPADEAEPERTPGAAASVQIMLLLDFSQCPKVTRSVRPLIALC